MNSRVIIAGSRNFTDYEFLKNTLDLVLKDLSNVEIVCGGAKGADSLGRLYASENKIPVKMFLPDWDSFGKSAGYIRNKEMAKYATHCVCFWDGFSKGTKHMIDLANEFRLSLKTYIYADAN